MVDYKVGDKVIGIRFEFGGKPFNRMAYSRIPDVGINNYHIDIYCLNVVDVSGDMIMLGERDREGCFAYIKRGAHATSGGHKDGLFDIGVNDLVIYFNEIIAYEEGCGHTIYLQPVVELLDGILGHLLDIAYRVDNDVAMKGDEGSYAHYSKVYSDIVGGLSLASIGIQRVIECESAGKCVEKHQLTFPITVNLTKD